MKRRSSKRASRRTGTAQTEKLWGGRFTGGADPAAERFTGSLAFDRRLWPHDVTGSVAWAKALARAGLLSASERDTIVKGLEAVRDELAAGTFPFRPELEDIHTNVERRLQELVGDVGGKLHTGRSRNDQIALDERLYLREVTARIRAGLRRVQATLVARAAETVEAPLPGYTHLQRAQPVRLAHHWLAFEQMLARDAARFADLRGRLAEAPLGAGALAGSTLPLDRAATAAALGFAAPSANSMDAVASRDAALEFLADGAICMVQLSRLAEELVLWSSAEFGFVELADAYSTGSSLMPQKKNPDVPELVRGKSGRAIGNLVALLTVLKGLPLGYNRDLQEDKEPLFDTARTLGDSLEVMAGALATLRVNVERMRAAAEDPLLLATDLAEALVREGVPFREAHEAVGKIVAHSVAAGRDLRALPLEELRSFHPAFASDAGALLSVERALEGRSLPGGTARARVLEALAAAGGRLAAERAALDAEEASS